MNLEDLIRYENENSSLDFKAVQYERSTHAHLLKDVLAMANADVHGPRHIVVGVKVRPSGQRMIPGILEDDFIDPSIYQQLVRENIEPEVAIDYFPFRFENVLVGVLRIGPCLNPPYMMRKKYGDQLREGDAFIRKGTHQHRLLRSDIDRMLRSRSMSRFVGKIGVKFLAPSQGTEIDVLSTPAVKLPSVRAREQITAILDERTRLRSDPSTAHFGYKVLGVGALTSILGPTPYEYRSDEQLKKDLEHVAETYREDDLHEVFERSSTKINLSVENGGETYLEDASIELLLPRRDGLLVADRIHREPPRGGPLGEIINDFGIGLAHYPDVTITDAHVKVFAQIGDLRHGIPERAFSEPLRVVFGSALVGERIPVEYTVRGKQLTQSVTGTLYLNVIDA